MTRLPGSRKLAVVATAAAAAFALLVALPSATAAGPNLLPNSDFEASVLEPAPVPRYTVYQPIMPTGWAFEGAAGLFDHTAFYCIANQASLCGGNGGRSGRRSIAISIPLGGKRQYCAEGVCASSPENIVKDAAQNTYSINPAWRNATPVPVTQGASYTLSVWTYLSNVTVGEGVFTAVRWYNSMGLPIRTDFGAQRRVNSVFETVLDWAPISANLTAPGGATGAVVLLGHTDDVWTGHVRFDDVFFGTT